MCGIAGFVLGAKTAPPEQPEALLAAMGSSLRHRGPDDAGQAWDGVCGFAHTRLSVIDLSPAGHQPMRSEDGRYSLLFNGEIYNFMELRQRFALDAKGYRFRSRTDTEVLLHLFAELGPECLHHLNGMFALAVWDNQQRVLHLARDPFGIKPLFYMQHAGALWFASEIKALLLAPGFIPHPAPDALYHYLSLDYIPGACTAFAGVEELRPGQRLTMRPADTTPHLQRFYELPQTQGNIGERDAAEQAQALLRAAVQRQLVADVPIGVMLSGGLDSSAIAALMAQIRANADFHTFSLAFDDPSFDESHAARTVATHLGTHHHEMRVTASAVRDRIPAYLAHIDEPYADGSAIPTWLLAQEAKDFVTVLLSGEGGDEIHAGYDTYAAFQARGWYRHLPAPLRQQLIRPLVDSLPVSHRKLSFEFKAKRFVQGAELGTPESHFAWREVVPENQKAHLLATPANLSPTVQHFTSTYDACRHPEPLARLMQIDQQFHLPDDLMIKNDRMTMAHSLEARVPFTDLELVNFLGSVPVRFKIKGLKRKRLLRQGLRNLLPRAILHKPKVGLEMPYSRWLTNEWRDLAETWFAPSQVTASGCFDSVCIQRLWTEHRTKRADHGRVLWGILNYLWWHDLYIASHRYRDHLPAPRPPRLTTPAPHL